MKSDVKLSETIKKPSENICISVFHFDNLVTIKLSEEWEKNLLNLKPIFLLTQ